MPKNRPISISHIVAPQANSATMGIRMGMLRMIASRRVAINLVSRLRRKSFLRYSHTLSIFLEKSVFSLDFS